MVIVVVKDDQKSFNKLISVTKQNGEIKEGNRLTGGTKTDIRFWHNRSWILSDTFNMIDVTKPETFCITKLVLSKIEYQQKFGTKIQ
jgi:hypothetical protein